MSIRATYQPQIDEFMSNLESFATGEYLNEDEKEFCAAAKKYNILVVPGSSFACPGYVRIAYCVAYETIVNSLPKFAKLAEEYK